jgi:protein FAM161A
MTAHFESKLALLAVTPPLDPNTGRPSTVRERQSRRITLAASFPQTSGKQPASDHESENLEATVTEDVEPFTCETVQSHDVSADEFYEQLQRLKHDHRKTLRQLEAVYNRARGLHEEAENWTYREPETLDVSTEVDNNQADKQDACLDDNDREVASENMQSVGSDTWMGDEEETDWKTLRWMAADKVVDMSEDCAEIAPVNGSIGSLEEGSEQDLTSGFSSQAGDDSPVRTVQEMWRDFSVDDYRVEDDTKQSLSDDYEWRPRITIPEPFRMTVQDERKAQTRRIKKSKAAIELEEKRLQKEEAEEAELRKKFKARPMPASAMVPLYEEMKERDEMRRAHMKAISKEILKSTEKPFSFTKREEEKKKHRHEMALKRLAESQTVRNNVLKANPVPREIFDPRMDEEIREEEEYRRIRIKMRAEETLAKASLPSSMKVKGRHYTVGNLRYQLLKDREKRAFLTKEHHFRPRVNQSVPDFEKLQDQFDRKMAALKQEKQTTTVEPFYLRTQMIPSRKQHILSDIKQDNDTLCETRWPFSLSRRRVYPPPGSTYTASADTMVTRSTRSSQLRENATRNSLNESEVKEMRQKENGLRLAAKQKLLAQAVSKKAKANDHTDQLRSSARQKLVDFLESDRERKAEYRRELEEMEERLNRRPFLFERESQINARRAAQLKYTRALKNAGLDDDMIDQLEGFKDDTRHASVALARGRQLEHNGHFQQDSSDNEESME